MLKAKIPQYIMGTVLSPRATLKKITKGRVDCNIEPPVFIDPT